MPRKPQPTIKDLGLKAWIDRGREKQNGFGYEEFVKLINNPKLNDYNIGKTMNKDWRTIKSWRAIYEETK